MQNTLSSPQTLRHARGFTLIEVLVTLVVFAGLSVGAMTVLSQSIAAKNQVDRLNESVGQLRRGHALLKADLSQLVNRPTRDAFGAQRNSSFSGHANFRDGPLLRFVRDGWENPSGLERRSSLQRVEYFIEENNLVRRSYYHPDSASDDQELDLVILSGVEEVEFAFFVQGQWHEVWSSGEGSQGALPAAIAIDIESIALGRIRQVFLASELSL